MSNAWRDPGRRMADWRKTRLWVLDRDKWTCRNCGKALSPSTQKDHPDAAQVHHTRGAEHGDDPQYLVACCRACNLKIGSPRTQDPRPKPRTRW